MAFLLKAREVLSRASQRRAPLEPAIEQLASGLGFWIGQRKCGAAAGRRIPPPGRHWAAGFRRWGAAGMGLGEQADRSRRHARARASHLHRRAPNPLQAACQLAAEAAIALLLQTDALAGSQRQTWWQKAAEAAGISGDVTAAARGGAGDDADAKSPLSLDDLRPLLEEGLEAATARAAAPGAKAEPSAALAASLAARLGDQLGSSDVGALLAGVAGLEAAGTLVAAALKACGLSEKAAALAGGAEAAAAAAADGANAEDAAGGDGQLAAAVQAAAPGLLTRHEAAAAAVGSAEEAVALLLRALGELSTASAAAKGAEAAAPPPLLRPDSAASAAAAAALAPLLAAAGGWQAGGSGSVAAARVSAPVLRRFLQQASDACLSGGGGGSDVVVAAVEAAACRQFGVGRFESLGHGAAAAALADLASSPPPPHDPEAPLYAEALLAPTEPAAAHASALSALRAAAAGSSGAADALPPAECLADLAAHPLLRAAAGAFAGAAPARGARPLLLPSSAAVAVAPLADAGRVASAIRAGDGGAAADAFVSLVAALGGVAAAPLALLARLADSAAAELLASPGRPSAGGYALRLLEGLPPPFAARSCVLEALLPPSLRSGAEAAGALALLDGIASTAGLRAGGLRAALWAAGCALGVGAWVADYARHLAPPTAAAAPEPRELGAAATAAAAAATTAAASSAAAAAAAAAVSAPSAAAAAVASAGTASTSLLADAGADVGRALIEAIRRDEFGVGLPATPEWARVQERQHARLRRAVQRLSADLYSEDVHLLHELLQNADDCAFPQGAEPGARRSALRRGRCGRRRRRLFAPC
jgi:hypothetical protein